MQTTWGKMGCKCNQLINKWTHIKLYCFLLLYLRLVATDGSDPSFVVARLSSILTGTCSPCFEAEVFLNATQRSVTLPSRCKLGLTVLSFQTQKRLLMVMMLVMFSVLTLVIWGIQWPLPCLLPGGTISIICLTKMFWPLKLPGRWEFHRCSFSMDIHAISSWTN